jgi:hypothetical protein
MMITHASAINASPARCRRFLDDAPPGSTAHVCGAPIAASYCPAWIA